MKPENSSLAKLSQEKIRLYNLLTKNNLKEEERDRINGQIAQVEMIMRIWIDSKSVSHPFLRWYKSFLEHNTSNKIKISENKTKIASLRFLLPKAYREEFIGDLIETEFLLKKEGHPSWWVKCLMILQIVSVVWHASFFKLKEWFVMENAKEINE